jgi:asparagine synthase (glutamine-hydrolysing)
VQYKRIEEYGEHFVELLDRAVDRRMRAPRTPGIMMSGGMDSTSVTALAARQLAAVAPHERLNVYSYVFDEMSDLDERQWMQSIVDKYGLNQTQVVGDDAWPLSDFHDWVWNPSGPVNGAFDPLNQRLFTAARADGKRVLLSGADSDSLFIDGQASWLADLVADGRLREAATEVARHVRRLGAATVLRSQSVRRLGGYMLGRGPGRRAAAPSWLTRSAAERIVTPALPDWLHGTRRHPADAGSLLDALDASDGIDAGYAHHRAGVEVRAPFSDLELVSYVLSVPAYALYFKGSTKFLLRAAMGARLPREILERPTRSDISALYWRGMARNTPPAASALLDDPDARWRAHVRADAVTPSADSSTGARALVPWNCLTFEWWLGQTAVAAPHAN